MARRKDVNQFLNLRGGYSGFNNPGGAVYWVGASGYAAYDGASPSDANDGLSPQEPFATIQAGLDACSGGRGDVVALLPGSWTITASLTMSKDDVTLVGAPAFGPRNKPSSITVNAASIDGIAVTGSNCNIVNVKFAASTTGAANSRINAGASYLTVFDCVFECGAYDKETITVPNAGDDLTVRGCYFYVTANGPDAAIEMESASTTRTLIAENVFDGGDDSNAWDISAVNSDVASTNLWLLGNRSLYGEFSDIDGATTGMIADNYMGEGTLGSMLDPGMCMCFKNYEADAVDETGREFPTGAAA